MDYAVKNNFHESLKLIADNSSYEFESESKQTSMRVSKKTISFIVAFIVSVTVSLCYICDIGPQLFPDFINSNFDHLETQSFDDSDLRRDFTFDLNRDTFVPLYIQKTGVPNLVSHIISDSNIQPRCKFASKQRGQSAFFDCVRKDNSPWLLSPVTGMPDCRPFPDWTALTQCVVEKAKKDDKYRKYHFITMLRDPVKRFISEHLHLQRGDYYIYASLCNGKQPGAMEDIKMCYRNFSRSKVTLDRFMACPINYAVNRQTRMLSDLRLVNCYNTSGITGEERDRIMLESAKQNLRDLPFFGLTEYQHLTKLVFEKTFNMTFFLDFRQFDATFADTVVISPSYHEKISKVNHNDVELYDFAKSLFFERVKDIGIE